MRAIFRDAELQDRFERDGFVQLALLRSDDLARLLDLHDRGSAELMAAHAWSFTALSRDPALRRTMSNGIRAVLQPRLEVVLDRCRTVIGNFFYKQPANDQSEVHIHQDWSWVDERQHHSLTVWCPFQPVDEANGTLAVIPGSHRLSERPRGFVRRFPYPALAPVLATRYSRHLALRPGEAILFDQRLFHWSGPNRSPAPRLAANCFVAPDEARIAFPFPDETLPDRLELLEVDDALLTSFVVGERPPGARSLGFVDARVPPLDEAALIRVLGPGLSLAPRS